MSLIVLLWLTRQILYCFAGQIHFFTFGEIGHLKAKGFVTDVTWCLNIKSIAIVNFTVKKNPRLKWNNDMNQWQSDPVPDLRCFYSEPGYGPICNLQHWNHWTPTAASETLWAWNSPKPWYITGSGLVWSFMLLLLLLHFSSNCSKTKILSGNWLKQLNLN